MRASAGFGAFAGKEAITLFVLLFLKSLIFVFLVPPWLGNDEPNHFEYVMVMAGKGDSSASQRLILASLEETGYWEKADMQRPSGNVSSFAETDLANNSEVMTGTRPPLYYLLASLPVRLSGSENMTTLLALSRVVSAGISLLSLWFLFLAAKTVFREDGALSLATVLMAGMHPQFSYISAVVNSDVLVVFFFTAFFYLLSLFVSIEDAAPEWLVAAIAIIALSLLAKRHSVILLPILFLSLPLMHTFENAWKFARWMVGRCSLLLFLIFLGVLLMEIFATSSMLSLVDRVALSLGYSFASPEELGDLGLPGYLRGLAIIFVTYWFTYGQMVHKLSFGLYAIYAVFSLLVMGGAVSGIYRLIGGRDDRLVLRHVLLALLFFLGVFLMTMLTFFSPELINRVSGRYLLYAIGPASMLMAFGIREAGRSLRLSRLEWMATSFFLGMNLISIFGYLIPIYHA